MKLDEKNMNESAYQELLNKVVVSPANDVAIRDVGIPLNGHMTSPQQRDTLAIQQQY